jgi:hypothetical protein
MFSPLHLAKNAHDLFSNACGTSIASARVAT